MATSFAIDTIRAIHRPAAEAPARGLFARLVDRLIEARMAQARIEIARHAHIAGFDARRAAELELFARD